VLHAIVSRSLAGAMLALVMVPACAAASGDAAAILAANRDATGAFAPGTVTVRSD
jgi:hypothetical protein